MFFHNPLEWELKKGLTFSHSTDAGFPTSVGKYPTVMRNSPQKGYPDTPSKMNFISIEWDMLIFVSK